MQLVKPIVHVETNVLHISNEFLWRKTLQNFISWSSLIFSWHAGDIGDFHGQVPKDTELYLYSYLYTANIQTQIIFFCSHLGREKWGKTMLRGQQAIQEQVQCVCSTSFPITMAHSWRPCWILSAGSILYHEHPTLTRKEVTKYSF